MSAWLFPHLRKPDMDFHYYFLPVGQGLFSAGSVHLKGDPAAFNWVYDCGTSSSPALIDDGIARLRKYLGPNVAHLDLLVLSHFDNDHISGVVRLIGEFRIENLMLPYMPLAQRLVLAFESNADDAQGLMAFYLDPTAYLISREGANIGRIIYVEPSPSEGGVPPPQEFPTQDGPADGFVLQAGREEVVGAVAGQKAGTPVAYLQPRSRIQHKGVWEFVPYNADSEIDIPRRFLDRVAVLEKQLRDGASPAERDDTLARLGLAYDRQFTKKKRNRSSLFLYGGPIHGRSGEKPRDRELGLHTWSTIPLVRYAELWPSDQEIWDQQSILYTGDGYLETAGHLGDLIRYLHQDRIDRIAVFQVMHHGAEGNWHEGVAAAIDPLISVFSSDPGRIDWGHPHAAVLRDFWSHGPTQVDKSNGLTVYGYIHYP